MHPSPRVILWILFASLLLSLAPMAPRASETILHVDRSYEVGRLRVGATAGGVSAFLEGLGNLAEPGHPALPVDRVTVEAPPGTRLADLGVRVSGESRVLIAAAPVAFRADAGPGRAPAGADPSIYGGTAPFPTRTAEILPGGYFRGRRMETVEIHPVRWLPVVGCLAVAGRVELELRFEPDDSPNRLRPRDVAWEPMDRFAEAAHAIESVPNPEVSLDRHRRLSPLVNGGEPFSPRFLPSEDGSPVRYLILTTDAMASSFQALADWKTALGFPAVVRTTSWIYANYPRGVDHAEDVRNFIREAVEKWGVEYVLLAGDARTGSGALRKVLLLHRRSHTHRSLLHVSGRQLGRKRRRPLRSGLRQRHRQGRRRRSLPRRVGGAASGAKRPRGQPYVTKVKRYETKAALGPGFGDESLLLGEVVVPQNWSQADTVLFDGADLCESADSRMAPGIASYRMYENYTQYPGSYWEVKPDVLARINHGYNLILHVGHGYRNTMSVGYDSQSLANGDVDAFYNGDRQGLLYAINCTSSAFDFDCIADHFIRNPTGGVVASIGSTRYDFPFTGRYYQDEFFHQVYELGVTRLGAAAALQKVPFISQSSKDGEYRWTQFNLILMGDPTLDLYTGPVDTLTATLLSPLALGQSAYTVQVSASSGPVEGATVCLNKAGDSYGYAVTDASGQAVIQFDPDLPGAATLGARAHNFRSRVDTVQVAAPAGPHLFAGDVVIDDAAGGDGDGTLEAGETAFLYPVLGNQGGSTATGVTVTVVQAPAGITVLDGFASCPEVLPDSTAACSDPFEVLVDPAAPDVSLQTLSLHIAAGGYSRDLPMALFVGAPSLLVAGSAWRDTVGNGNGDGIVQAGEDQFFRVTLENLGLGVATGLTASLASTDPAVQISDGASVYGDLEPDSSAAGDGFLFRFTDSDPTHSMRLTVTAQGGVLLDRDVNIVPPAAPVGLAAQGGAEDIGLRWYPVTSSDLSGYNVYRAFQSAGPFARVNATPIGRISYYRDEDLPRSRVSTTRSPRWTPRGTKAEPPESPRPPRACRRIRASPWRWEGPRRPPPAWPT